MPCVRLQPIPEFAIGSGSGLVLALGHAPKLRQLAPQVLQLICGTYIRSVGFPIPLVASLDPLQRPTMKPTRTMQTDRTPGAARPPIDRRLMRALAQHEFVGTGEMRLMKLYAGDKEQQWFRTIMVFGDHDLAALKQIIYRIGFIDADGMILTSPPPRLPSFWVRIRRWFRR